MGNTFERQIWDFQQEKEFGHDIPDKVAVRQQIPLSFEQIVCTPHLLVRLLKANGHENVDSIEVKPKVKGGLSQDNRRATITYKDETTLEILIKGNKGSSEAKQMKPWREAIFYLEVVDEEMRKSVNCPELLLGMVDEQSGQHLMIMKFLDNHAMLFDVCTAHSTFKSIKEVGGQNCTVEGLLMDSAEQIAALHASHWNDQALLEKSHDYFMHSNWLSEMNAKQFNQIKENWSLFLKLPDFMNHKKFKKVYPQAWAVVAACLQKHSWEDYQRDYATNEDFKSQICLLHGDFHPKQVMFNKETQKTALIDFEFCGWGPGAVDLCTMMQTVGLELRKANEKNFLIKYHDALIASGKVDPEVMTLEKVTDDYIKFFVPRIVQVLLVLPLIVPSDWLDQFVENLASFIEEKGITVDNVAQPYYQFPK